MEKFYSESDIVITIVAPPDEIENVPSYINEACESNAVDFQVVSKPIPDQRKIFELLSARFGEITVSAYREGHGRFFVAAVEPPVMGEVINLTETPVVSHIKLEDYFESLENHDWFFSYSDDPNTAASGAKEEARLSGIAQSLGGDFQKLMRAFRAFHFSGKTWNTPQAPKPLRPLDGELRFDFAPASAQEEPEHAERDELVDIACSDDVAIGANATSGNAQAFVKQSDKPDELGVGKTAAAPAVSMVDDLVIWEVSSALGVYKAWLARANYRSWSHQLLCWAGSSAARDIDAELSLAEQRARAIVNRSASHIAAAKSIAGKNTCPKEDAAHFASLFSSS